MNNLEQQDVEATFQASHVNEGKEFHRGVTRIPLGRRIYVDETWISACVRRRIDVYPLLLLLGLQKIDSTIGRPLFPPSGRTVSPTVVHIK